MLQPLRFLILLSLALAAGLIAGCGSRTDDLQTIARLMNTDPTLAATKLRQFVAKNPRDDLAWTLLGHTCEDLDLDQESETAYHNALAINPTRVQALTGMGILCRKRGDYVQAMSYWERAVAIDPNYAHAYSSMTAVALKQNQDAKALDYARKGYALDQTDPVIASNLALACHYNGLLAERDRMTEVARRLGYKNLDGLQKIYRGELSVRDE